MSTRITFGRRAGLAAGAALLLGAAAGGTLTFAAGSAWATEDRVVTVYRSPTCGCCGGWVTYLQDHGFEVDVHDVEDPVTIKELAGVPEQLYSCHTAAVDSYTIEGHVPVEAIERLLEERPEVQGIGVGGMPAGSPGMGGTVTEPYTAYTFSGGEVGEPFMTFPAEQ